MGGRKYLVLPTLIVFITFLVITVWEFAFEVRVMGWLGVAGADLERQVARRTEALEASNVALRTSEERYRLLMETSPDAVFVDRDDKIVFVNQVALKVFGAASEAVIVGRDPMDFIHPDDHASAQARRGDLAAGRAVNPVIERRGLRLDGSEFAPESRATRTSWDGAPASLVVMRDVTERKLAAKAVADSEVRLGRIMDSAADGIITIDERGTIESISRSAILAFGYAEDEVLGRNISMLMPEPHRSAHDGYLARYRDTGTARIIGIGPRELTGQRKDGSQFPSEVAISEARLGGKRIFIGIVRDITDRKREPELFQQAQKMEAVGQLTGGVAHDFNNLLTTILGNLELLSQRFGGDARAARLADTAMKATLRGAELTQRLLAFSRKQPLDPSDTEINKCLLGTTELMRRTLGEDIEIETVLAGGPWDAIVDRNQLGNALLNIAINARDAMPGGGRLTIETANSHLDREYSRSRMEVMPGQYVTIAISDTGAGMAPEIVILFTSGYTENAIVHQGRLDSGVNLIAKPYRREALAERVRSILDERGN